MAEQNRSFAVSVKVEVGGEEISQEDLHMFSVEQDLDQPDMATITLRNDNHEQTPKHNLAEPVEVKASDTTIFKGEIVAIEGRYKNGGESQLVLRAFNKLHRLSRARKSRTFTNMDDSAIVNQIVGDYSLSAQCGSTSITHEHVYQHNQTDLEFLRVRAARIGFDIWVEDTTLHFDKPELSSSAVTLELTDPASAGERAGALLSFSPRLSSAQVPTEVKVIGWDPDKKDVIYAEADSAELRALGKKKAVSEAGLFGSSAMVHSDHPVASQEEANAMAKARLDKLSLGFITGEGTTIGNPAIKAGIVATIKVNLDQPEDLFNGDYHIVGCTHRFRQATGPGGGYLTIFRVERNASGGS